MAVRKKNTQSTRRSHHPVHVRVCHAAFLGVGLGACSVVAGLFFAGLTITIHSVIAAESFEIAVLNPTTVSNINTSVLGSYDTPSFQSLSAVIQGRYAYVAAGQEGLKVFDVNSPARPRFLGGAQTQDLAYDVAVVSNTAYVAVGNSGVQIFDVTVLASPRLLATYDTPLTVREIEVVGSYAYVNDFSSLLILDIRTPSNPILVGRYVPQRAIYGVAIRGSYAYLAAGEQGVEIVNITNPAVPVRAGVYTAENYEPYQVQVLGTNLFVADRTQGLKILDLTAPTKPRPLGEFSAPTTGLVNLYVYSQYALLVDQVYGVTIVDVKNPLDPRLVGSYSLGRGLARSVVFGRNSLFVSYDTEGLYALSFTPTSLTQGVPRVLVTRSTTAKNKTYAIGRASEVLTSWVFDATTSDTDVYIEGIDVVSTAADFKNLAVFSGSAAVAISSEPVSLGRATTTLAFEQPLLIPKGAKVTLTLRGDSAPAARLNTTSIFGITSPTAVRMSGPSGSEEDGVVSVLSDDGPVLTARYATSFTIVRDTVPINKQTVKAPKKFLATTGKITAAAEPVEIMNLPIWISPAVGLKVPGATWAVASRLHLTLNDVPFGDLAGYPVTGDVTRVVFPAGTFVIPAQTSARLGVVVELAPGVIQKPGFGMNVGFGGADGWSGWGLNSVAVAQARYSSGTTTSQIVP